MNVFTTSHAVGILNEHKMNLNKKDKYNLRLKSISLTRNLVLLIKSTFSIYIRQLLHMANFIISNISNIYCLTEFFYNYRTKILYKTYVTLHVLLCLCRLKYSSFATPFLKYKLSMVHNVSCACVAQIHLKSQPPSIFDFYKYKTKL